MKIVDSIREYALRKGYYNDVEDLDDDYEYDVETETYEDEEPVSKKRGKSQSKPSSRNTRSREAQDDEYSYSSGIYGSKGYSNVKSSGSKVVSIHNNPQMQVIISFPESIEEAGTICEYIKENKTVVVNLENIVVETAQRIIDFLGGVSYALEGDIQYVSNKIFIIAPKNVDISGQFKEELKDNGMLYSFKRNF